MLTFAILVMLMRMCLLGERLLGWLLAAMAEAAAAAAGDGEGDVGNTTATAGVSNSASLSSVGIVAGNSTAGTSTPISQHEVYG